MQSSNAPIKLKLPFASSGGKNTIPNTSQIGIVAGAASYPDGFPPLTRTPLVAGGVPPSGLDMNGVLFEMTAVARWLASGTGFAYDSAWASDSNVGGYPKGARVMRSDGMGYWLNTTENNTTDPEAAGAAAAGWVSDFTNGVTSVVMSSANVTLTPLQYGKPIIVITGTLTANLNLIFPSIVNEWAVINNTIGPYTINCKTSAGTGVVVNTAAMIVGDGTNIQSAVTDAAAIFGETVATATGGTADAITATFPLVPRYASNGVSLNVRATATNATTTPTFTPNSGVIAAATIVKGNNLPLVAGDIAGAGHWLELAWDSTLSKWVLLNPATGVTSVTQGNFAGLNSYNASATLPTSDLGKLVAFYGSTAAQTLTLPAVAGVAVGKNYILVNQASVAVTIKGNASENIGRNVTGLGQTLSNTLTLNPGDSIVLSSNGTNQWNADGQSAPDAFPNSLGANGYQKLPNGLIIQWGNATASGASGTITFPVAFTSACHSIVGTQNNAGATQNVAFGAPGITSVTFYGGGSNVAIFWIAVGK